MNALTGKRTRSAMCGTMPSGHAHELGGITRKIVKMFHLLWGSRQA